jgi:hypothetical protein
MIKLERICVYFWCAWTLSFSLGVSAEEPPVRLIIRAAQLLDVAMGRIVKPGVVVVAGDRIESINAATFR